MINVMSVSLCGPPTPELVLVQFAEKNISDFTGSVWVYICLPVPSIKSYSWGSQRNTHKTRVLPQVLSCLGLLSFSVLSLLQNELNVIFVCTLNHPSPSRGSAWFITFSGSTKCKRICFLAHCSVQTMKSRT